MFATILILALCIPSIIHTAASSSDSHPIFLHPFKTDSLQAQATKAIHHNQIKTADIPQIIENRMLDTIVQPIIEHAQPFTKTLNEHLDKLPKTYNRRGFLKSELVCPFIKNVFIPCAELLTRLSENQKQKVYDTLSPHIQFLPTIKLAVSTVKKDRLQAFNLLFSRYHLKIALFHGYYLDTDYTHFTDELDWLLTREQEIYHESLLSPEQYQAAIKQAISGAYIEDVKLLFKHAPLLSGTFIAHIQSILHNTIEQNLWLARADVDWDACKQLLNEYCKKIIR